MVGKVVVVGWAFASCLARCGSCHKVNKGDGDASNKSNTSKTGHALYPQCCYIVCQYNSLVGEKKQNAKVKVKETKDRHGPRQQ